MISNNLKFLLALLVLVGVGAWWYSMPASVEQVKDTVTDTVSNVTGQTNTTATKPAVKPVTPATRVFENGVYVSIVNFTSKGFDPAVVLLNKGEEVRFINQSNLTMRIVFEKNGAPSDILGLNQETSVGKGGKYQVHVNDPGAWTFYNLNGDKTKIGVMTVK